MGVRWQDQELQGTTPLQVLEAIKSDIRDGTFNQKSWDHNHPDRQGGLSNKQVKIVASMLLGRPDEELDMDEAWGVVLGLIL